MNGSVLGRFDRVVLIYNPDADKVPVHLAQRLRADLAGGRRMCRCRSGPRKQLARGRRTGADPRLRRPGYWAAGSVAVGREGAGL